MKILLGFVGVMMSLLGIYLLYLGVDSFRGSDTGLLLVKAIIVSLLGLVFIFLGLTFLLGGFGFIE